MSGVIYGIKVAGDDRFFYVGQTRGPPEARWRGHMSGKTPVATALRLFGDMAAFDWVVIETVEEERLNEREAFWITELKTLHPAGLNMMQGGFASKRSEATRARMAEANRRRWADPDYKKRVAQAIRAASRTKPSALLGSKKSEDHVNKMRENARRQFAKLREDPDFRRRHAEAVSQGLKGRSFTEASRAKMAEAARKRCSDPEWRRRASEAQTKRMQAKREAVANADL